MAKVLVGDALWELIEPHRALREAILAAWRTNNRITRFLFEHLPPGQARSPRAWGSGRSVRLRPRQPSETIDSWVVFDGLRDLVTGRREDRARQHRPGGAGDV